MAIRLGSATSAASAGTVLGTAKDPAIFDEKTDKVTPPFIPETSDVTCAATVGFCKM